MISLFLMIAFPLAYLAGRTAIKRMNPDEADEFAMPLLNNAIIMALGFLVFGLNISNTIEHFNKSPEDFGSVSGVLDFATAYKEGDSQGALLVLEDDDTEYSVLHTDASNFREGERVKLYYEKEGYDPQAPRTRILAFESKSFTLSLEKLLKMKEEGVVVGGLLSFTFALVGLYGLVKVIGVFRNRQEKLDKEARQKPNDKDMKDVL